MSENQWTTPEAEGLGPQFISLIQSTLEDMTDNFLPFLLSPLLLHLLLIPFVVVYIFAIYAGAIVGAVIAIGLDLEDLAPIFAIVGAVLPVLIGTMVQMAVFSPLTASLHRAMRDFIDDEVELDFKAPLRTPKENYQSAILVNLSMAAVILGGSLLFLLPGLIASVALLLAPSLVYQQNYGVLQAMKASVSHLINHPSTHLKLLATHFVAGLVAGAVPIVGQILLYPFLANINYRVIKMSEFPAQ